MEYINGNSAVVRGAVQAGCDFFAGYPITPATSILLELTRALPARGGVVLEAEDEIASCGLCIGAAMAGRRVMTATSGPGLSLSSESIGLAIMGEVPLVFIVSQRMGPATGGATTTSDGDVQFVRWGTSGGYPIIALAPWNLASAYVLTQRAFALAAALRTPVFVMLSKELSMSMGTVDLTSTPTIEVGPVAGRDARSGDNGTYQPYALDRPDSIPAFAPIGGDARVRFTTSIHDADGVITTDPAAIERKLSHLVAKIESRKAELELCVADLQSGADTLIVCYGVVAGAARQAVRRMRAAGRAVSLLIVESLWPVPERAISDALVTVNRIVVPEMNPGLYVREIERLAGDRQVARINSLTGKLISPERIMAEADQ